MAMGQKLIVVSAVFVMLVCGVVMGCKCRLQKPAVTYCLSHWTAHAIIKEVHVNATNPAFASSGFNGTDVRYKVKFVQVFKAPEELNGTLPLEVYTPEDEAACGLILQKGGEYLLSGRYINDTLISMLCGQILYEDFNKSKTNDILAWKEVPKETVKLLESHAYDSKCR